MARPVGETKQKELIRGLTSKELWTRLETAMRNSGVTKELATNIDLRRMLEEKEDSFNKEFPAVFTRDRDHFMYATRVHIVRHLLFEDNNWVIRWVSNPKRLSPVNVVKEMFLKHGHQALPEHYKHATKFGGVFRWEEDALVTIIMMLRGLGKSHNDVVCRSIHDYIRDPSEKCLIGHSEDDKAEELIKRIRDALFHPNLMIAYPEFFVDNPEIYRARGVEIRKERINMKKLDFEDMYRIIDPTDYMRGEATWNLFTPRVDVTGQHFNRAKLDDFVTEANSATVERSNKIIEVFRSLSGLEEYVYDEKGETRGMPIQITDTQYAIPNMITDVLDNRKCKAFIMPMTWDPDEHKTIYHYAKEHIYQIDRMVTPKFIDRKKEEFTTEAKFLSQCYMIGYLRNALLKLVDNRESFMFAFSDESGIPETVTKIDMTRRDLVTRGCNIISKDPSYQDRGKNMQTDVSKDTTVGATYYEQMFFITSGIQTPGAPTQSRQIEPILDIDRKLRADVLVIDSASYQFYIAEGIFDYLRKNDWIERMGMWYEFYKKKNDSKLELANEVLGSMFSSGLIKVHWTMFDMIKEIMREAPGFDYLDALIQICSLDKKRLSGIALTKQYMSRENKILPQQSGNSIIFRTTGY